MRKKLCLLVSALLTTVVAFAQTPTVQEPASQKEATQPEKSKKVDTYRGPSSDDIVRSSSKESNVKTLPPGQVAPVATQPDVNETIKTEGKAVERRSVRDRMTPPEQTKGSKTVTSSTRTIAPSPQPVATETAGEVVHRQVVERPRVEPQMPVFPGGPTALQQYIRDNLKIPAEVKAEDLNGRVIVEFYVEADGSVDNVSIVQSLHPLVDAEMVRVVSAMPTWAPGIDSLGQPTQTKYQMPYSFGVKPAR